MKKINPITMYFSYLFIIILLFSCHKDTSVNEHALPIPIDTTSNRLDAKLALKLNECVTLTSTKPSGKNDTVTLCFNKIINDGRCLKSNCYLCYGSRADIRLLLIQQKDTIPIVLSILGCLFNSEASICDENYFYRKDTLGYRICALRLDPYPDTNNIPIKDTAYLATIKIKKL